MADEPPKSDTNLSGESQAPSATSSEIISSVPDVSSIPPIGNSSAIASISSSSAIASISSSSAIASISGSIDTGAVEDLWARLASTSKTGSANDLKAPTPVAEPLPPAPKKLKPIDTVKRFKSNLPAGLLRHFGYTGHKSWIPSGKTCKKQLRELGKSEFLLFIRSFLRSDDSSYICNEPDSPNSWLRLYESAVHPHIRFSRAVSGLIMKNAFTSVFPNCTYKKRTISHVRFITTEEFWLTDPQTGMSTEAFWNMKHAKFAKILPPPHTPPPESFLREDKLLKPSNSIDDGEHILSTKRKYDGSDQRVTKRLDYLSWDDYFVSIALLSAQRSKDPSTQVGACIVNRDQQIVGIGYNGFPWGCSDDSLPWAKDGDSFLSTKYAYVCHAEMNAILNKNSASVKGCRMFTSLFPCNECAKIIIQSGISEVIFLSDKYAVSPIFVAARRMFDLAGVQYRKHFPRTRHISLNLDVEQLIVDKPPIPVIDTTAMQ